MGAPAAAIIVRRERQVVDAFRRAGAVEPRSACSLAELALDETRAVKRLQRRSVLREAEGGRYYLDEPCWDRRCGMRRQLMFTIVGIALLVLLAVLVSGSVMRLSPQALPTPPGDTLPSVTLPSAPADTVGYIIGGYSPGSGGDIGKFVLALRRADDSRWPIAADIDNGNSRR